jgi:membrane protease YdiL (CAAX protease family)
MKRLVRRYPFGTYFGMTLAISWSGILIALGPQGVTGQAPSAQQLGFVYLAMLLGPSGAGLLLILLTKGKVGLQQLWQRLSHWQVSLRWYVAALLIAPLSLGVTLLTLGRLSPLYKMDWELGKLIPAVASAMALGLIVGLCEEIGWSGFATPSLRKQREWLATGLLIGLAWGLWHFPLFWEANTFTTRLGFALLIARLLTWLPAYRILMVWLYGHTQSLLLAVLMHASLVASQFVLMPPTLDNQALFIWLLTWALVLWLCVGLLMITTRSRHGIRHAAGESEEALHLPATEKFPDDGVAA